MDVFISGGGAVFSSRASEGTWSVVWSDHGVSTSEYHAFDDHIDSRAGTAGGAAAGGYASAPSSSPILTPTRQASVVRVRHTLVMALMAMAPG